jgi:uncharacterized membrane protein required for colicin V production
MSGFDIVLIIILAACALRGFTAGLIKAVGSFVGLIAGSWLASHFYLNLAAVTQKWYGGYDNIGKVVSFIIILVVATWAIHFLFIILDKTYNLLAIIPFLKSINRLAGAALTLFVGALILGLLLYVVAKYAPAGSLVGNWLTNSKIAPTLLIVAKILMPLLSGSLKDIKSLL